MMGKKNITTSIEDWKTLDIQAVIRFLLAREIHQWKQGQKWQRMFNTEQSGLNLPQGRGHLKSNLFSIFRLSGQIWKYHRSASGHDLEQLCTTGISIF